MNAPVIILSGRPIVSLEIDRLNTALLTLENFGRQLLVLSDSIAEIGDARRAQMVADAAVKRGQAMVDGIGEDVAAANGAPLNDRSNVHPIALTDVQREVLRRLDLGPDTNGGLTRSLTPRFGRALINEATNWLQRRDFAEAGTMPGATQELFFITSKGRAALSRRIGA